MEKNQITESIYEDENSITDELQEPIIHTKQENDDNDEYYESSHSDDSENPTNT